MLRLHPDVPPHVVAFTIDGTVTAPDMDDLYRAVEKAMGGKTPVHVVGEIHGVGGLTLDAVRANVQRGAALLPRIGRVRRYAVVTDVSWIARLAEVQAAVLPGVTVRTFAADDREAAFAWASEPPEA
jgi:hypothetical protein